MPYQVQYYKQLALANSLCDYASVGGAPEAYGSRLVCVTLFRQFLDEC